jgi:uncharacterized membrane protein (GlpM family)
MDILWKGIGGGLVTAAIVFLSKRGNTLPGILPLFPTFALIALLVIGAKGDQDGFRETCLAVGRLDYRLAIAGGLAAWFVVALGIFLAPLRP